LLSLAVIDDLGAILVIAILFTGSFDLVAVASPALYRLLQRRRVRTPWVYVPAAVTSWVAVHSCGVHATVAGLLTRVRADPGEEESPCRCSRCSRRASRCAGTRWAACSPTGSRSRSSPGLVIGKLVGIVGPALLVVRLGVARLPSDLGRRDLVAVAMLGGVGFTVSLLIADLSLDGPDMELAKGAVLVASALASVLAAVLLPRRSKARSAG
jgi:NhaA family Na+:H+ antiporter